jgi:hypothetical protein
MSTTPAAGEILQPLEEYRAEARRWLRANLEPSAGPAGFRDMGELGDFSP